MPQQDPNIGLAPWMGESLFWVALFATVALVVATVGLWVLVRELRRVRAEVLRLSLLEDIDQKLGRVAAEREDLDLRRVEHLLLDLRESQKRTHDALLRVVEREASARSGRELVRGDDGAGLVERVTTRLIALGFEQVQIVNPADELARLAHGEGALVFEARRDGVQQKGRVFLSSGRIERVDANPAYSIFP